MTPPSPGTGRAAERVLPGGVREMSARELIEALHTLRDAPRDAHYWTQLAEGLQRLTRARAAWLLRRDAGAWQTLAAAGDGEDPLRVAWVAELDALVERAAAQGFASCPGRSASGAALWFAAVRQERLPGGWLLLAIPEAERPHLNELLLRAQLVADLPTLTPPAAATAPAAATDALSDVAAQLAAQQRFGTAALTLVNTLAQAMPAQQVVLGWRAAGGERIRAVAISHRDRFDRFAHPVVLTEDALDESLDHDGGVLLCSGSAPELAGATPAHDLLQRELGGAHVLTLPLARPGEPACAAVLLALDGQAAPPTTERLRALQRVLLGALPWLHTLHERERALPLRAADAARRQLALWLGPGRTWWKAGGALLGLALVYSMLATWEHRVSAGGQLVTDSTRVLGAQFDGRVDEAVASAGDEVAEGAVLARLDTRELRQQETDARAELKRYTAEADKARAAGALADLEVASARAAQSQARLERVLDQLAQSQAVAPFAGVVVEGERKELQGAPVRKGDKLYRIARVEGLYATLQVPERDAAYVKPGAAGEMVLVTRPDDRIPLRVLSVVPVAQTKGTEGNHFLVRAELLSPPADWWRPGMSGNARIDAGEERVFWILTHRVVDTVRLWLWW